MRYSPFVRAVYAIALGVSATNSFYFGILGGQCQPSFDWSHAIESVVELVREPDGFSITFALAIAAFTFFESSSAVATKQTTWAAVMLLATLVLCIAFVAAHFPCVSIAS